MSICFALFKKGAFYILGNIPRKKMSFSLLASRRAESMDRNALSGFPLKKFTVASMADRIIPA